MLLGFKVEKHLNALTHDDEEEDEDDHGGDGAPSANEADEPDEEGGPLIPSIMFVLRVPRLLVLLLMYKFCITLRTLNYGNFLIMGDTAGFISSTVAPFHVDCFQLL